MYSIIGYMEDIEFLQLSREKGRIVKALKDAVQEEANWCWMVIDENPKKLTIELRKIPSDTANEIIFQEMGKKPRKVKV